MSPGQAAIVVMMTNGEGYRPTLSTDLLLECNYGSSISKDNHLEDV